MARTPVALLFLHFGIVLGFSPALLHQTTPQSAPGLWGKRLCSVRQLSRIAATSSIADSSRLETDLLEQVWETQQRSPTAANSMPQFHEVRPAVRSESNNWFRNFCTIFESQTLSRIRSHLLANVFFAVAVYLFWIAMPQTAAFLVKGLNTSVHSLLGGALGLLLVFRTNSAYDRFWEARKIWGSVVTSLRELSRVAHSSLTGWDREHLLQLLAAFPPVLLQHLRSGRAQGTKEQKAALRSILSDQDVALIWDSRHRPFTVCKMIGAIFSHAFTSTDRLAATITNGRGGDRGRDLTKWEISIFGSFLNSHRQHADKCVTELVGAIGNAERIVKTSVPLSYSHHTSRFLSVWCFSLPLVLVEPLGFRMVPVVAGACWALLAIEEVGNLIEDPFNMPLRLGPPFKDELKLERSFRNIRGDIMDRSPATEPVLLCRGGSATCFQDHLCFNDYDLAKFHKESSPSIKGTVVLPRVQHETAQTLLGVPHDPSPHLDLDPDSPDADPRRGTREHPNTRR